MNNDAKGKTRPQVRSGPLITSAVLVGAGTFFVLTGLAVGSSHLLSVARQRVREMAVPPNLPPGSRRISRAGPISPRIISTAATI